MLMVVGRAGTAEQRWKCQHKVQAPDRRPHQRPLSPSQAAGGCCQSGPVPLPEDFSGQNPDQAVPCGTWQC